MLRGAPETHDYTVVVSLIRIQAPDSPFFTKKHSEAVRLRPKLLLYVLLVHHVVT